MFINWNLLFEEDVKDLESLVGGFSLEEIKGALFSFASSKVLGLNGFPFAFFQRYWDLIKDDLFVLLHEFYGKASISVVSIICLFCLFRRRSARDFSSISLLNSLYKLIAKILARRLASCLPNLIAKTFASYLPNL